MAELIEIIQQNTEVVNSLIALLALVVSFISICLAFYTAKLQRTHNFKSMTPIASFPIGDYEDKIEVALKNTGVGPLIVSNFSATVGKSNNSNLISLMPQLPVELHWDTFHANINGACIPPNEQIVLICLSGEPEDDVYSEYRDQIRRTLSEIKLKIKYQDIYKRNMPSSERELSWFGRHFE